MRPLGLLIICFALLACSDSQTGASEEDSRPTNGAARGESAAEAGTIDCSRAFGQAQQAVCNDAALAVLDREETRLHRMASADPAVDPSIQGLTGSSRRAWARQRDECWKADDLRQCIVDSYVDRIADLRGLTEAMRGDSGGISEGPLVYRCDGATANLVATFVNGDPGLVHLNWAGPKQPDWHLIRGANLTRTPGASGSGYEGKIEDSLWSFSAEGEKATLTRDERKLDCTRLARARP